MGIGVTVHLTGIVRHHAGVKERRYELPEGAAVSDLLRRVGEDLGHRMPPQMWDAENKRFHPVIRAARRGAPFLEDGEALRDGDEVFIISRMAGG
ncbi:MAG: MoaD/ThiS family protein [Actinomycetota bacterium]|nr:MoaD/ThiS family protein [Actinomycetota bacterium]